MITNTNKIWKGGVSMDKENEGVVVPSPKDFNLMVLGQVISIQGATLLRFALSLYVLDATGSEAIFAILYAISNIPLLLAPLGGAIADRFNRRNLMVIFDFISSAIVFLLFALMAVGNTSIPLIGTVMVLLASVSALYTPTVTASIPLLVEHTKLEAANGIVQAVQALSGVAAPILGGIFYSALGMQALVAISGVSFFLSAVMEIFIKIPFTKREQNGPMILTIAGDLKDGFRYVAKVPFILKSMVLAALLNLLLTPYFVVGGPIILRVTMQSSDAAYGFGMGVINAATILGALSIGFFAKRLHMKTLYRPLLVIAALLLPMSLAISPLLLQLGFLPPFVLFLAGAIPVGMRMTIVSIFVVARVQKRTPNEMLGKVMAIITAAAQCAAPLGQVLYGLVFGVFSARVYIPTLLVAVLMLGMALLAKELMRKESEAT